MTAVPPLPPVARRDPRDVVIHGARLEDDYGWLKSKDDQGVREYLEAENRYARSVLAPLADLEESLYHEMLGRIKQTDLSVPYRYGDHWYYTRTEEGKQYPFHCRKRGSEDPAEELLLDLNAMAEGHSFLSIGAFAPTIDGRRLGYTVDVTGFREYQLEIKDLATGQPLIEPIRQVGSVVWAADGETFFYSVENDAKRDYRIYRQRLGEAAVLVFEEPDERFRVLVTHTRSRHFLILYVASHTTTEVRVLPAAEPLDPWQLIAPRVQDREYDLDHHEDRFFIRVNDTGRNFRIVTAPVATPGPEHWTELVAHRDEVMIEGVECFRGHWVAWERVGGLPRVRVTDLATGAARSIGFEDQVYEASPGINLEWDTTKLRYGYESFVTPQSVYEFDMAAGASTLLKRREVLGGYDPTRYRSERLSAFARDGTAIPISVVWRRDFPGPGPCYLTGYGAYGISYPISFNSNRLSLLDRGVAFAVAHVRGGGEMGRRWHDRGRMAEKMNSFTDFIAAADHLVATGRTSHDRLVIEGGSAGGLLIGAVLNLRPDLCRAALLQVPFLDVINTMRDASLPLTVGEYEEWGNPTDPEQFRWLARYCPYTNLGPRAYPAIAVRTSINDSQVMYWEPAKWVAKLRTLKTDHNPLLLITNLGAGHSGASGRYDRLREIATDYTFVLWQLGLASGAPA